MICIKVIIACKHFCKTFTTWRWFHQKVFSGHTGVHHLQDDENVLHTFNTSREQERNRKLIPKYWVRLQKFLSWLHYMCWIEAPPSLPCWHLLPSLELRQSPLQAPLPPSRSNDPGSLQVARVQEREPAACRRGKFKAGARNSILSLSHNLHGFEIAQQKDQDNSQLRYVDDTILNQL